MPAHAHIAMHAEGQASVTVLPLGSGRAHHRFT